MSRSVVILAGGANRRMGAEKWLLPVGGTPVLGRLVRALDGIADDVAVVLPWGASEALRAKAEAAAGGGLRSGVRWVADEEPDAGPLAGIEAAFAGAAGERCAVVAADMPFPRRELLEALFEVCRDAGAEAAIPERGGRLHPLFAVYRTDTLEKLRSYRRRGGRKVMEWLGGLNAVVLAEAETAAFDPDGTALFNMNTPDDYDRAKSLVDD